MPEFDQEDAGGVLTLKVHFATEDDVSRFAALIEQKVTLETRSIWFPEQEPDRVLNRIAYVGES
jgi:hypothetical protein